MSKDLRFMRSAVALAEIWSKDPSTKVCSIAVGNRPNLVAWGYNGFPPGISDHPERLHDREQKLQLTLHAEVNALANAPFEVQTLYVTRHPCAGCALHILAARTVKRVVYLVDAEFEARWADSLATSASMLREGGITVEPFAFFEAPT
ncbi:MAG: deaminase [Armatimonadia bacterium]